MNRKNTKRSKYSKTNAGNHQPTQTRKFGGFKNNTGSPENIRQRQKFTPKKENTSQDQCNACCTNCHKLQEYWILPKVVACILWYKDNPKKEEDMYKKYKKKNSEQKRRKFVREMVRVNVIEMQDEEKFMLSEEQTI